MHDMRIIGHVDMDAFFASVEERNTPHFRGMPIVVGASPQEGNGRGVVSTANYAARAYGIHSAMPIRRAWLFSQQAEKRGMKPVIFLPVDSAQYSETSEHIMRILHAYVPLVEEAGIDEAYIDVSFCISYKKARNIAERIKKEILLKEKITASIGIGPNKLIAKIASDFQKPDGLTLVQEDSAEEFLEPLGLRKIPGIGPKSEATFMRIGVRTVREAKQLAKTELENLFGKWGSTLYDDLRGKDSAPLVTVREAKSIGEEETFEEDTLDASVLFARLNEMCRSVITHMHSEGFSSFRTAVLKVRFSNFETKTRSHTFMGATADFQALKLEIMRLLMPFLDTRENPARKRIRLLGVRLEKLGIAS
jgi:DNA polymerase IV (archaeal DinB-like DNA polymerase)